MSNTGGSNKFSKEIDKLVRYIKDNMEDENDWVVVKYRDVPELTGISSYYVRKIFELLKDHPNIVFEIDKDAKTYRKPLKFKYTDEEKKIKSVVTEKSFYYLTQEEIDYIQDKLGINTYEKLFKVLNMVNYIASSGAKEDFTPLTVNDIADILVEPKREIKDNVEMLKNSDLLIDKNGHMRLILNMDSLEDAKEEALVFASTPSPTKESRKGFNSEELINKLLEKQASLDEDMSENSSKQPVDPESLLNNLNNFRDAINNMQSEFQDYLNSEVSKVLEFNNKEEEMNEGYETLQKLVEENNELTSMNKHLTTENDRLEDSLKKSQEFRDKFIVNAEQRLEILLAEVIGIISNYSKIPDWQKDQAVNARLQKNILNAVTSSVDDMLNIDTNS